MATDVRTRSYYLQREIPLIAGFLKDFRFADPGIRPSIEVGNDRWQWLRLVNFPLSDDYRPDHENIVIVVFDYPEFGPAGIHVARNSSNKARMQQVMRGHMFNYAQLPPQYLQYVEEVPNHDWICFHYANWRWNFNPRNIMAGDNLVKYIEALYANLTGGYRA